MITRADMAAARARRAGRSTLLQDAITTATREITTSLSEIAREVGVSESTLSSWRRGGRIPKADALEVLADVLDDRAATIRAHAKALRDHARALRTPAGRANLLLDGVLRERLRRHFLEARFKEALYLRLGELPGVDPDAEATALASELIAAAEMRGR